MRENKILIVEDDRGLAEGIKFYLEKEGYQVVMAGSLGGGRVLYQQEKPDAVLLDLNLPDGDGMSFCREIRKNSQVPILMVTARDMESETSGTSTKRRGRKSYPQKRRDFLRRVTDISPKRCREFESEYDGIPSAAVVSKKSQSSIAKGADLGGNLGF